MFVIFVFLFIFVVVSSGLNDLFEFFIGIGMVFGGYVVFKVVWLFVVKVKGLEILGIFIYC